MIRKKAGLATKIHAVDEVVAAETSGAAIADPKGLGASLKQARLARGLSLADVSASLRLRGAYLDAIENDRREALPGPVYANGYVRSYAAFLGMDPDEAVRRFKREAGDTRARSAAAASAAFAAAVMLKVRGRSTKHPVSARLCMPPPPS
ncbi:MAG: helix-turn-helix domain-containing protein, partial [Thalassobaculaceae bacterium]